MFSFSVQSLEPTFALAPIPPLKDFGQTQLVELSFDQMSWRQLLMKRNTPLETIPLPLQVSFHLFLGALPYLSLVMIFLYQPTSTLLFIQFMCFQIGQQRPLFIFFGLFKQWVQFLQQINMNNVHLVYTVQPVFDLTTFWIWVYSVNRKSAKNYSDHVCTSLMLQSVWIDSP